MMAEHNVEIDNLPSTIDIPDHLSLNADEIAAYAYLSRDHDLSGMTRGTGLPDLVDWKGHRAFECKRARAVLSPSQRTVFDLLDRVGIVTDVVIAELGGRVMSWKQFDKMNPGGNGSNRKTSGYGAPTDEPGISTTIMKVYTVDKHVLHPDTGDATTRRRSFIKEEDAKVYRDSPYDWSQEWEA
jgi:hypothetical protein